MFPFLVVFGAALFVASGYVLGAVAVAHGPALGLRLARLAIRAYGVLFLGLVLPAWRVVAGVGAIALAAAVAAAALSGVVSAARPGALASPAMSCPVEESSPFWASCAGALTREPGDVLYQPSLAIRADGRLALADGVTFAEAAADYAGPGDYWAAACRATLDGYEPVVFEALDASRGVYWRASISRAGAIETSGPGRAALAPLAPFLEELAQRVRCK
jgi:hypothetical protein